jgi:ribonuclease HI
METFLVYCDGGAINNPGPAGIGVVIKNEEGKIFKKISEYIGKATNNQAEYRAVIKALEIVKELKSEEVKECKMFLDSELIVNQLNFKYKVKNSELQPLFLKVHNLVVKIGNVRFFHIPREQNKEADKLVRKAIKKGNQGRIKK